MILLHFPFNNYYEYVKYFQSDTLKFTKLKISIEVGRMKVEFVRVDGKCAESVRPTSPSKSTVCLSNSPWSLNVSPSEFPVEAKFDLHYFQSQTLLPMFLKLVQSLIHEYLKLKKYMYLDGATQAK